MFDDEVIDGIIKVGAVILLLVLIIGWFKGCDERSELKKLGAATVDGRKYSVKLGDNRAVKVKFEDGHVQGFDTSGFEEDSFLYVEPTVLKTRNDKQGLEYDEIRGWCYIPHTNGGGKRDYGKIKKIKRLFGTFHVTEKKIIGTVVMPEPSQLNGITIQDQRFLVESLDSTLDYGVPHIQGFKFVGLFIGYDDDAIPCCDANGVFFDDCDTVRELFLKSLHAENDNYMRKGIWKLPCPASFQSVDASTAKFTLYARYEDAAPFVKIVYGNDLPDRLIEHNYGSKLADILDYPKKDGMCVSGWFLEDGTPVDENRYYSTDLTLYARWCEYVDVQIINGDFLQVVRVKNDGKTYQFPDALEKPGYKFAGWFDQPGGEGTRVTSVSYEDALSAVYAYYEKRTYTLTFESEGFYSFDPITYEYGDQFDLPSTIARSGCIFAGWCTDEALSSEPMLQLPEDFFGDWHLYPKFEQREEIN